MSISLFENNSLIRLGTSPMQCSAGWLQGFPLPGSFVYFHLWPQHSWLILPYQQGSEGTDEAFSCILLHLVTSDLQLLERSCRVVFSRRSHHQQGQCPAYCSVPLQQAQRCLTCCSGRAMRPWRKGLFLCHDLSTRAAPHNLLLVWSRQKISPVNKTF